jgi:hypothetical protein
MLSINQRKYTKHHHLGQGKEIILFIKQRLKLTICVGHRSTNLVWDPLYNAPSAPSIGLFSQYSDHLKEGNGLNGRRRG